VSADARQLATFRLEPHWFGIDVASVQEVVVGREIFPVPLAPPEVAGLVNLRGQIVTVVDLRRRLALDEGQAPERPALIVLRRDRTPVALAVDAPGEVTEVDEATFEPPPETLRGEIRKLIPGAHALENGLLLLLDLERVLEIGPEPEAGTGGEAGEGGSP